MFSKVILVIVLLDVISCQPQNWPIEEIKNEKIHEIRRHTNLPRSSARLKPTESGAVFTRRTFVPSFRVILLEISLMAISVFLVNSLENYIKKPKNNRPKNRNIEEELARNFENILRNFK